MSRVLRLKREERAGIVIPAMILPENAPPGGLLEDMESDSAGTDTVPAEMDEIERKLRLEESCRAAEAMLREAERRRDQILEEARAEARSILDAAARERDSVFEQARREGYEAGYREGIEEATARTEALIAEAGQALEEARNSLPVMMKELEPKILALCLEISRKVLEKELREDPETILSMARQGLRALKDEREFSLRVNPFFVAILDGSKDQLIAEFSARSFEVIGDDEIPPDGVVVKTPHGLVDARIETQLGNIARAIAECRQKVPGPGEEADRLVGANAGDVRH